MKWSSCILVLLALTPVFAEPVLVGSYPAKIVPEQLSILSLPDRGEVSDLAPEGRASAGAVLAVLNKKRMEEEREDMEFKLAKERITRRDELRQLRQQREKLVFYLNLGADERKYAADTLAKDTAASPESLSDIDERIALVQRELDTMEKRQRDEFERSHEKQTLRMPFNGRFQYNVTLPEDRSQSFEFTGMVQTFITACDDSSYYVTIGVSSSDLSLLPEKKLSVRVDLPEGRELVGQYAFRRVERTNGGADMLVYFFRLPAEDSETAYDMLGSNTRASLFYTVDGSVERVSKTTLAAHAEASKCESWRELVNRVYPGAVVVVIGDRDVVIRRPEGAESVQPAAAEGQGVHEAEDVQPQ